MTAKTDELLPKAMGAMGISNSSAVFGVLDCVFLNEHPAVAAFFQRFYKFVSDIGMVRQRHLARRKTFDAGECLCAEDRSKEVDCPG